MQYPPRKKRTALAVQLARSQLNAANSSIPPLRTNQEVEAGSNSYLRKSDPRLQHGPSDRHHPQLKKDVKFDDGNVIQIIGNIEGGYVYKEVLLVFPITATKL
ncbi:MAG: hypothetical protein J7647_22275 [Cyanobacteria bacterium SBLK]|nr:hypothetical protein [Cyanobacteria bacterium SBLK]